jgi:fructose-specific component phosphotransferase system IIB-like protein
LKNHQSHIFDLDLEAAEMNGVHYVRDHRGKWRYAESWILVPGARDLTLTEKFQPKAIVNAQGEAERVVVSGDSIREAPDLLGWCVEVGTAMRGPNGELDEVFVPYSVWRARDRVPNALVAPEHSEAAPRRAVAEIERKYREADQALKEVAEERADVLRRFADRMTREEAHEITDLSVGRIQQLIRREKLTELEVGVLEILQTNDGCTSEQTKELLQRRYPRAEVSAIDAAMQELVNRRLIKAAGQAIRLTREGREALPSPRRSKRAAAEVREG